MSVTVPGAAAAGVRVLVIDTSRPGYGIEGVSSADVRTLMTARDWNGLRVRGWLHPRVLEALESTTSAALSFGDEGDERASQRAPAGRPRTTSVPSRGRGSRRHS